MTIALFTPLPCHATSSLVIAISPHTIDPQRSIILHAHMFKNAGTTLDWSLKRCFGSNFVDHRDDDAMRGSNSYLAAYLNGDKTIEALSSHWLTVPPPRAPGLNIYMLMLLRNPLERCRSVYNFEKAQAEDGSAGVTKAKSLSFTDYIDWRLEPNTGPVIKNFHTRYCSGDYFGKDVDLLYKQALNNVQKEPTVGLVHRYAESMVLFEHKLQDGFPDIDLSWRSQNIGQHQATTTQQRIDSIADELGQTFDSLVEANEYDLRLVEYVERKMDRELALIPHLQMRLQSLHKRNALLK